MPPRSNSPTRVGITTTSATSMASSMASSRSGGVSTMMVCAPDAFSSATSSARSPSLTCSAGLSGLPRSFHHTRQLPCGSQSTRAVRPSLAARDGQRRGQHALALPALGAGQDDDAERIASFIMVAPFLRLASFTSRVKASSHRIASFSMKVSISLTACRGWGNGRFAAAPASKAGGAGAYPIPQRRAATSWGRSPDDAFSGWRARTAA